MRLNHPKKINFFTNFIFLMHFCCRLSQISHIHMDVYTRKYVHVCILVTFCCLFAWNVKNRTKIKNKEKKVGEDEISKYKQKKAPNASEESNEISLCFLYMKRLTTKKTIFNSKNKNLYSFILSIHSLSAASTFFNLEEKNYERKKKIN